MAKCLDQAKGHGEFKHLRTFRFIHLFSGPRDVLGEALKVECAKEGLQLEVLSYDKSVSSGHDLAAEQPFGGILEEAKQQGFDGAHSMWKLFQGKIEPKGFRARPCTVRI